MNDPLFNAAWPQATETRRAVDHEHRREWARRARAGELGGLAQAIQLEFDAADKAYRADMNRQAFA